MGPLKGALQIWHFMGSVRLKLSGAVVMTAFSSIALIFQPMVVSDVMRRAINGDDWGVQVVVLVLLIVASAAMSGIGAHLLSIISEQTAIRMRSRFFEKLLRFPITWFGQNSSGDMVTRVSNDVNSVKSMLSSAVVVVVSSSITLAGASIAIFSIDVWLSIIVVLVIMSSCLFAWVLSRKITDCNTAAQHALGQLGGETANTISGIRIIKAYGQVYRQEAGLLKLSKNVCATSLRVSRLQAALVATSTTISQSALIVVVLVGGGKVLGGELTIPELTAFMLYANMLVTPFNALISQWLSFKGALGVLPRVTEVANAPYGETPHPPESSQCSAEPDEQREYPVLRLDEVAFSYNEDAPLALCGVSLSIMAGERVAIVGASGAGKSTLFGLLLGFMAPDQGQIVICGTPLTPQTVGTIRDQVGYVDQNSHLIAGTIRQNLSFDDPRYQESDLLEALAEVDLGDAVEMLPLGLDTYVGMDEAGLSGGERQRIAIARALLRRPRILLLDEPESALDSRNEQQVATAIASIPSDVTVLTISHRASTLSSCDRVFLLDRGNLVEQDPVEYRELPQAARVFPKNA